MPGYTHLKRAEPVTFGHWCLAYVEMLLRDAEPLRRRAPSRADECPLGSGALSGTPLPVDREALARSLGFVRPTANSLDAVSDRDAAAEYLFASRAPPRPPLAPRGGPHRLHVRRVRLRDAARRPRDGLVADAAEEEPGRPRARARPRRARDRRADRAARGSQGAAARLRQGPPARQGAGLPRAGRPRAPRCRR